MTLEPEPRARWRVPDGPLTLGIRPEHLGLTAVDTGTSLGLAGRVDFVEWLGAEILVHLALEPEDAGPAAAAPLVALTDPPGAPPHLIARLDPAAPVRTGERLRIFAALGHLHLFDPDSGRRLPANTGDSAHAPG